MRILLSAAALLVAAGTATGAAAQAGTYTFNFDAENGGNSYLNYNSFNGFDVTGGVDLTKHGDYYACAGGSGSCVDLDGSPGPGRLTSAAWYTFGIGDKVSLSFDLAGNSRNATTDDFYTGFDFATPTTLLGYTDNVYGSFSTPANYASVIGIIPGTTIAGTAPFTTYKLNFTAGSAGSLKFFVGTSSMDNVGPVLDNLSLRIGAVPEPATWGMMILGFGAVGGILRRRSTGMARKTAIA